MEKSVAKEAYDSFVHYVETFYMPGYDPKDTLYPLYRDGSPLNHDDVVAAVDTMFAMTELGVHAWCDGDSCDREQVRRILEHKYDYKEKY